MKLTVKDLKERLANVSDTAMVTFQGNVASEDDSSTNGEPSYTTTIGYIYEAFPRGEREFVIDCAITDREG